MNLRTLVGSVCMLGSLVGCGAGLDDGLMDDGPDGEEMDVAQQATSYDSSESYDAGDWYDWELITCGTNTEYSGTLRYDRFTDPLRVKQYDVYLTANATAYKWRIRVESPECTNGLCWGSGWRSHSGIEHKLVTLPTSIPLLRVDKKPNVFISMQLNDAAPICSFRIYPQNAG